MHDLVIRNGKIVDGTGRAAFAGDVAIAAATLWQWVTRRVRVVARSTRPVCWSRPGWVDIHTHYDGQVAWDPYQPLELARRDHARDG